MIEILTIEAIATAFLALLVAGLLRSHAAIIRALHLAPDQDGQTPVQHLAVDMPVPADMPIPEKAPPAVEIEGVNLNQEPLRVSVQGTGENTLLAFLSTGCLTCARFWEALAGEELMASIDARVVAVTKGPEEESAPAIQKIAPQHITTVMSSKAWADYEVPMYPYFVYIDDRTGEVKAGGAADSWEHVLSLLEYSLDEIATPTSPLRETGAARLDEEDAILAAAGIGPDHPSLYSSIWTNTEE